MNGYNVIVQNTTKIGDIVVFFPQECCICEQFLKANNQYSISDYELNENIASFRDYQEGNISKGSIPVLVIPTNEEVMILRDTVRLTKKNKSFVLK